MSEQASQKAEEIPPKPLIPAYRDTFVHYLFATPGKESEESLLDFVNAVLENDDQPLVQSVETKNPFNPQTFVTDKYSILDVKATDASGDIFVVEFQTSERAEFANRMMYYCCKSYSLQMSKGESYVVLCWVIGIAVTAYLLHRDLPDAHNSFHLVATANPKRKFAQDGIQIHTLEVTEEKEDQFGNLKPRLRSWTYLFYYSHQKSEAEMTTLLSDNPVTLYAYERYLQFNGDEQMRALDDAHQRYLHDYATDMGTKYQQGLIEGKIEEKIEVARKMKNRGDSVADIAELTGLSIENIKQIN
jgi:predicted transposase/invertase (TIGR01784 family)